ncbi:Retrotransposon-derived protein PEG10 [Smittium culicis]|uniref:Retrotransposon-derived protein PEG10 n=1 Tax=Smittium culicis TaxID=133412 RepID=A0A1R1XIU4_9FUNG|nr:Retrotransposon-derived protein PEG10 [Smittium culicis]
MNQEEVNHLIDENQRLSEENAKLIALQTTAKISTIAPTLATMPNVPIARISLPERYDGDRSQFRGFTNQCRLLFFSYPDQYNSATSKVSLVMSLLTGNALRWASPYIEKGSSVLFDYELFMIEFSKVFDDPQRTQTANDAIRALRQGSTPVSMYASEFRRLMMDLDWNESALVSQFSEGLHDRILDTLALFETPSDLEGYINAAITVDARLTRRKDDKSRKRMGKLPGSETNGKPVLNLRPASTELSPRDIVSPSTQLSCSVPRPEHDHRFLVQVTVHSSSTPNFQIKAMIDSGASGMFINKKLAKAFAIPTVPKKDPVYVEFIDGSPLNEGPITHETIPLKIQITNDHWEETTFEILSSNHADMILGLPWLERHEPTINWAKRKILFEGAYSSRLNHKSSKNPYNHRQTLTYTPQSYDTQVNATKESKNDNLHLTKELQVILAPESDNTPCNNNHHKEHHELPSPDLEVPGIPNYTDTKPESDSQESTSTDYFTDPLEELDTSVTSDHKASAHEMSETTSYTITTNADHPSVDQPWSDTTIDL